MGEALAALSRADGFTTGRMMRLIRRPPATVWQALTDPAMLTQWLAPGRIELKVGGAVRLDFADSGTVIDSQVSAFEDGALIEYSWSKPGEPLRPVRWAVAPEGDATRLTLTVLTPDGEDPGRACAGWEAHLAMLAAALAGAPIAFPFDVFKSAREAYRPVVAALD